jgi:RNA-directed DNA polymerase
MTFWPPHLYRESGSKKGISDSILEAALQDAFLLQRDHLLPPLLTLKHLSVMAGCSYLSLRRIVERNHRSAYRYFRIRKRSGGTRLICVPCEPLLRAQKWINRFILQAVPPHPCSLAFSRGQSNVECARRHCGSHWLIKLDVRRFFESISERQVFQVFTNLGYRPLVAFELGRLTTRVPEKAYSLGIEEPKGGSPIGRWNNSAQATEKYSIEDYRCDKIGHLPQGAPTSPLLSNLCVRGLDEGLATLAQEHRLVYTRYADDIVFSTTSPFSRQRSLKIAGTVYAQMKEFGLRANTTKTSIVPPGARKVVLGLLVDRDRPRLQQSFKKEIELHMHYLTKPGHGPKQHAERRGFDSVFGLKLFLEGKISYASSVEPEFGKMLRQQFNTVEWPFN